ncbi:hypothetical protein F2P81_018037 [Scophthalmus maximus]|uniref:Uncharacterized protein n=1 Tax=Scophthalmus maximus TaxID=52904 RepID=A0A6A4SEH3_SCOMX|nr:hypothetical protein F2P81_018037 [Scophthalmus maximus]
MSEERRSIALAVTSGVYTAKLTSSAPNIKIVGQRLDRTQSTVKTSFCLTDDLQSEEVKQPRTRTHRAERRLLTVFTLRSGKPLGNKPRRQQRQHTVPQRNTERLRDTDSTAAAASQKHD